MMIIFLKKRKAVLALEVNPGFLSLDGKFLKKPLREVTCIMRKYLIRARLFPAALGSLRSFEQQNMLQEVILLLKIRSHETWLATVMKGKCITR